MNNRIRVFLIVIILVMTVSCQSRSRSNEPGSNQGNDIQQDEAKIPGENTIPAKTGRAIFFIENSGSMLGYVSRANDFKNTIVSLSYLPGLDNSDKGFYFINGTSKPGVQSKININYISSDPDVLKENLSTNAFKTGDPRYSDLNRMFGIALDSAKDDRISILVSDCIYDVGEEKDPLMALKIETQKTQQAFRRRLEAEDIQTVILKTYSGFDGRYYFASRKGSAAVSGTIRPYYILFFGKNDLLNNLITERKLAGRIETSYEIARFLPVGKNQIPYQVAPSVNRKGDFRPDPDTKNKLTDARPLKGEFQFAFAADFSSLSFLPENYLSTVENYSVTNPNYIIAGVEKISGKIPGVTGTHLITVATNKNPLGEMEVVLENSIPAWVSETHAETEDPSDSTSTFGFRFLTGAISKAYEEKNAGKNLASFKIVISR